MKYLVILYVVFTDGSADKKAIYDAKTQDEAVQMFYKYMGQYTNGDNVESVNVEAKDSVGTIYKNDAWVRPTEE